MPPPPSTPASSGEASFQVATAEGARELKAALAQCPPELVTYPFPLRPGLVVRLELPSDLTFEDVTRITGYLQALQMPAEKEESPCS